MRALLLALLSIFLVAGAKAQIYQPDKMVPTLGEIRDDGTTGCIDITDTELWYWQTWKINPRQEPYGKN